VHLDSVPVISLRRAVVAIILHEISHGVLANWFGADTAKRAGRRRSTPLPPHNRSLRFVLIPHPRALRTSRHRLGEARARHPFAAFAQPGGTMLFCRWPDRNELRLRPRRHRRRESARSQCNANGASFVIIGYLTMRVLLPPCLFAEVNLFLASSTSFRSTPPPRAARRSSTLSCRASGLPGW